MVLNAFDQGRVLPILRHRGSSDMGVPARGRVVEEYYDELERICTEAIELTPGGQNVVVNIPIGQRHTVRALESGSVLRSLRKESKSR